MASTPATEPTFLRCMHEHAGRHEDILRTPADRAGCWSLTVAESMSPRLLFETGLPVRYYLPKTHVRMDLLERSETVTHCPYKGQAETWSVRAGERLHEDVAWSYPGPLPESERIAGLIAFYDEKVDIWVDGVQQERPSTKFS